MINIPKLNFLNKLANKKTIFILFGIIFAFCFLMPETTHAFVAGLIAYFQAAADALEDTFLHVTKVMIMTAIAYGIGYAILTISSVGIDYVLQNPSLLSLKNDVMVTTGWEFTLDLANLILVVLFVIVAFTFILKIEMFQPKKALRNLIIVAIVINFSFLFCQALVDMSNIIMTSLSNATSGGIAETFSKGAIEVADSQIKTILIYLTGTLVTAALSVVGYPLIQVAGLLAFNYYFLGNMLNFFMQLAIITSLGGVMITYFLVLIARIVFIKLLVIIAPLACLAFVLPQTESMGKQWLNMLLRWTFFIVPLTFFLLLGYVMTQTLPLTFDQVTFDTPLVIGFFDATSSFKFFFQYLILLMFLAVALIASYKFIPKEATEVIEKAKSLIPSQAKDYYRQIGGAAKEGGRFAYDRYMDQGYKAQEEISQFKYDKDGNIVEGWEKEWEAYQAQQPWYKRRLSGGIRTSLDKATKGKLSGRGLEEGMEASELESIIKRDALHLAYSTHDIGKIMSTMESEELQKVFESGNLSEKEVNRLLKSAQELDVDGKERIVRNAIGFKNENGEPDLETADRICKELLGINASIGDLVASTDGSQVQDISAEALKIEGVLGTALANWSPASFAEASNDESKLRIISAGIAAHQEIIEENNLRAKRYFLSEGSPYEYPPVMEGRQVTLREVKGAPIYKGRPTFISEDEEERIQGSGTNRDEVRPPGDDPHS